MSLGNARKLHNLGTCRRELVEAPYDKYPRKLVSGASVWGLRSTQKVPKYPKEFPAILERFVPAPKLPGTPERRIRHS